MKLKELDNSLNNLLDCGLIENYKILVSDTDVVGELNAFVDVRILPKIPLNDIKVNFEVIKND